MDKSKLSKVTGLRCSRLLEVAIDHTLNFEPPHIMDQPPHFFLSQIAYTHSPTHTTMTEKRWDRHSSDGIKVLETIPSGKFDLAAEDCARQIYESTNPDDFGDYDQGRFKRNVKNMIADYLSGKGNLKSPGKAKMPPAANDDNKKVRQYSHFLLYIYDGTLIVAPG